EDARRGLGRRADERAFRVQVELVAVALEDRDLGAGPARLGVEQQPVVVEHDPAAPDHRGLDPLPSAQATSARTKDHRSSGPAPMPISFAGSRSWWAMAIAIPPLAEPSSLVSTMPLTSTAWPKSRACWRPFWPVVASTTSSVSCGAPSSRCAITRLTFASSSI